MNSDTTLIFIIRTLNVVLFLGFGTILLLTLERRVYARSQHRPGSNHAGAFGQWQIPADLIKMIFKWRSAKPEKQSILFYTVLPLQIFLPFAFMVILLGAWNLSWASNMALMFLFLLITLSVVLEALYLQEDSSPIEKYEYRRYVGVNLIGLCGLMISIGTIALHTGSLSLTDVEKMQESFPYHTIFLSPGLFMAALCSLLSIFYILAVKPLGEMGNKGILGRRQYLYFIYKRIWFFAMISFWVFLFAGGGAGALTFPLFCLRLAILLAGLVVFQASIPKLRAADAMEMGMRFLLPVSLFGLVLEIFWTGWWAK